MADRGGSKCVVPEFVISVITQLQSRAERIRRLPLPLGMLGYIVVVFRSILGVISASEKLREFLSVQ